MGNNAYKYTWRCIKCTYHFSNIHGTDGMIKQEKKCPKCKSINLITLTNKDIYIHCKFYDPQICAYNEEVEESHMFFMNDQ